MVNVTLGDKTYTGVAAVKTDTPEGGTVEFAPYEETFAAGKAEGIEEGYANGKADGVEEGYANGKTEGIAEGVKAEYDRFWDSYQNFGRRSEYMSAFCKGQWNDITFKPKYDIVAEGYASNIFWETGISDLKDALHRAGVVLDTSRVTYMNTGFAGSSKLARVPELSVVSVSHPNGLDYLFNQSISLVEVEKLILKDDGSQNFTRTFDNALKLSKISIEGTIGNDINFQWSPLSGDSIGSVVSHLSDSAAGKTVTFKLSAVNSAFETAEGAADGSASEAWAALIATKSNWTISCV